MQPNWNQETWNRINQAVQNEMMRTCVARKFMPIHGPVSEEMKTVPADLIETNNRTLLVDEGKTIPILEIQAEFRLTSTQIQSEEKDMTAVTLATRAANLLAQAEDLLIFQGKKAKEDHPLFKEGKVQITNSADPGTGLIHTELSDIQVIPVNPLNPGESPSKYGEKHFAAVADAYSRLESGAGLSQAHYGPFAGVWHAFLYADTCAPLENTLIMPKDRIEPLLSEGFYGTGTLPEGNGLVVSLGGNTMDLVISKDASVEFQTKESGMYIFRVWERIALRLKDSSAVVRIEFQTGATSTRGSSSTK